MKKVLAAVLVLAAVSVLLSTVAFAAEKDIAYYDENGNSVRISGLYYNAQGLPTYDSGCYYLDENGNPVYLGGCRAYYCDEYGNLVPGQYYYDENGNAVAPPSAYRGGCCGYRR
jgi:hypothetical protein